MKIDYKFSATDIDEILKLLNVFLKHISIVTFSRSTVELADPEKRLPGSGDSRYSDIVKVINRWGIRDEEGKYYELLNDIVGKISSCCPMLQIYKPIELLLFNKLLESRTGGRTEFTKEEIDILTAVANQAAVVIENANLMLKSRMVEEELKARKFVERAKGILMKSQGISEEEAYRKIQKQAMNTRRTMREIAEAIILAKELD